MKIKNLAYQNLWNRSKTMIRGIFIILKAYFRWLSEVEVGE